MDEVRCDKPRLARPDLLLEPGLQRHVVGHAPQQRHRSVRVRVDEPGDQHVVGQRHMRACTVIAIGVGCAQNGDDAAAVDDQRVVGQHARRLDGHDPARIDAQVNR